MIDCSDAELARSHAPAGSWPFFESTVAALISGPFFVLDLGAVDWTKPIQYEVRKFNGRESVVTGHKTSSFAGRLKTAKALSEQATYVQRNVTMGVIDVLKRGREPPLLPEDFEAAIQHLSLIHI